METNQKGPTNGAKPAEEHHDPLMHTFQIEGKDGNYLAPVSTSVRRVDTVVFVNNTDSDVSIQFGKDDIFDLPDIELLRGEQRELKVDLHAPEGFHAMAVFCHATGTFARGGSMPIIIVDPKK